MQELIDTIRREQQLAQRTIDRYSKQYEHLYSLESQNKLSNWGYYDLGYNKALLSKNADIIDILDDILRELTNNEQGSADTNESQEKGCSVNDNG
jgi:site-specific recombinase XerC